MSNNSFRQNEITYCNTREEKWCEETTHKLFLKSCLTFGRPWLQVQLAPNPKKNTSLLSAKDTWYWQNPGLIAGRLTQLACTGCLSRHSRPVTDHTTQEKSHLCWEEREWWVHSKRNAT